MCIGKAFIVRKGQRWPDYLMDSNDHSPLVKKFNLDDSKLLDRNFVRLETWPLNSLTSLSPRMWEVNIDEEETLPAWFADKKNDYLIEKPLTAGISGNTKSNLII